MLLRTRLLMIALAVLLALGTLFSWTIWQRDSRYERRLTDEVLEVQRIAWEKIRIESVEKLHTAFNRLGDDPAFVRALALEDRTELSRIVEAAIVVDPKISYEVYSAGKVRLYSSVEAQVDMRLLDAGLLNRVLQEATVFDGLTQISSDQFRWIRTNVVYTKSAESLAAKEPRRLVGVLAAAVSPDEALAVLKRNVNARVAYVTNLRGRPIHGEERELLERLGYNPPARAKNVIRIADQDKTYLASSQPLFNADRRSAETQDLNPRHVGMLLTLRDETTQAREDIAANRIIALLVFVTTALLVLGLFLYLRLSLAPLNRAVSVLDALARGDTDVRLPAEDEESRDEAGRIARGISVLREEMVNFQMLRDERNRANLQQERLIKEQLKQLANSLDPASREEIVRQLEGFNDPMRSPTTTLSVTSRVATLASSRESENQLASLAATLTRLSELVTNQQQRLLKLLHELQEAMETKARFASLQQELEIARQMQLSILPRAAPDTPAVEMSSIMIPAKEVGGDFYDFFLLDDQRLAVVVADVSGKGVPAAFFMAISRTLLKNNAIFVSRPSDVITLLNDQLCVDNDQMMFVTIFYGILDLTSGVFTYVNAGHNPPIHIKRDGTPELLPLTKAMALAVLEGQTFPEGTLKLAPGETMVFYTDGVTEATNSRGELYGEKRLLEVLQGRNGEGQAGIIPTEMLQSIRQFELGEPQADDITTVAMTFMGGTPKIE